MTECSGWSHERTRRDKTIQGDARQYKTIQDNTIQVDAVLLGWGEEEKEEGEGGGRRGGGWD